MIRVTFNRGIYLPDQDLWLDPRDSKPFAFVSHAHADHIGRHQEVILSTGTAALMRARLAGDRIEHSLDFEQRAEIRGLDVTLYPAGHVLGSAQLFLESDAGSLLYTGDFKLRPGLSAEPTGWRQADTLIMETTFGKPQFHFPPTEQVLAQMVGFCREAMEEGDQPVLFGYSLGKAQEILCALAAAGLPPMLHAAVHNMTRIYRKLRPDFPDFVKYDAKKMPGHVLIVPPNAARSVMVRRIRHRRTAVLTGWAITPGAHFRYGSDAAFPLSDHADYPDLLRYVELVQPKQVLTVHGYATEFARDLRERGIDAWALGQNNQLDLGLAATPRSRRSAVVAEQHGAAPAGFERFTGLITRIASTTSKLEKTRLLADFLASLDDRDLATAAVFLTGRPFPQSDPRVLQAGWAVIKRALVLAARCTEAELREVSARHHDAAATTQEILDGRTRPEPLELREARAFFERVEIGRGPVAKTELLREMLERLTPAEGGAMVKILTGDLRIGLKEGLVEDAIATAFGRELPAIREANMLTGDLGETAQLARADRLSDATLHLFRPIKCMLASPEPDAEAIWRRLAAEPGHSGDWWAEDKFDGIRAQLHRDGTRAALFSRDLKDVSRQFAEVIEAAALLPHEVVLDGEIVAYEEGRKLSFFDLQKRLGRTTGDLFLGSEIPVTFIAFDLLHCDGASFLKRPLHERRARLDQLTLPPRIGRVALIPIDSPAAIDTAFDAARARRNEGLIIKDGRSLYLPGRRGLAWLKLKKELATLDVAVVAVESGHGRRKDVLSDYTFAVRDDTSGELLIIGKAYSGLTDLEIEQLTEHFTERTVRKKGHLREVEPDIVLEIAFDSIQPSTRHQSGLAMRFPRIKSIRRDKTIGMIDTLTYARSLVAS